MKVVLAVIGDVIFEISTAEEVLVLSMILSCFTDDNILNYLEVIET